MKRLAGFAALALLVLAGWAAWTAGIFDGPMARQVRVSSVYAAPGVDLDRAAAERIIGNRRLVAVFLDREANLDEACDDLDNAASGTLVVLFKPDDDEFEHYGCSKFYGDIEDADGDEFGKAFAMEELAPAGADQFLDRPLEAVKILAVNYDTLVKAGVVPDGARTIEPSAPRYLLAVAAVLTVIGGAVTVFLVGRRIGRLAARHQDADEAVSDTRASLNAKAAVLAKQIIDMDRRPDDDYRKLAADYAELAGALTEDDPDPGLAERIERLTERARELTRTGAPAGSRRRPKRAPSR